MCEQTPVLLGEPVDSIRSCVEALLPNLVGTIVHLGSSSLEGSSTLQKILNSAAVDAGLPAASVDGLFAGGVATDGLITSGKALLSDLFGRKMSSLNVAAVGLSGLRDASGAVLLAMATPFALGLLKREAGGSERWIAASELAELLEAQKPHLRRQLSERLFGPFGAIDTAKWLESKHAPTHAPAVVAVKPAEEPAPPISTVTKPEKKGGMRWLAWIVLGLLALLLLGYCMKRTPEPTQSSDEPASAPVAVSAASDAMASSAQPASAPASETASAALAASALDTSGAPAAASDIAASATVASEPAANNAAVGGAPELKVYFGYGKAMVQRDFTAKAQPLVAYAREHADARFSVSGFTDASGSPALNEALADRRAKAVRTALAKGGVALSRIDLKKSETVTDVSENEARRAEVHVMQ
ncbi:OmpA family protein [Paraburkholderia domus]|nr:OmpA family protein [Paraburkholderia domus]